MIERYEDKYESADYVDVEENGASHITICANMDSDDEGYMIATVDLAASEALRLGEHLVAWAKANRSPEEKVLAVLQNSGDSTRVALARLIVEALGLEEE